jgi:hypothetical protein
MDRDVQQSTFPLKALSIHKGQVAGQLHPACTAAFIELLDELICGARYWLMLVHHVSTSSFTYERIAVPTTLYLCRSVPLELHHPFPPAD